MPPQSCPDSAVEGRKRESGMIVTDTFPRTPGPARAGGAGGDPVVSWLAEIAAQVGTFGPGGELSLWGVQTAVAQSAVVVTGLVVGLALVGRWTCWRGRDAAVPAGGGAEPGALDAVPRGAAAVRDARDGSACAGACRIWCRSRLLVWLLRAPLRQWLRAGLVIAVVFLATKEVALRWFSVDELYVFPDAAWDEAYTPVDVEALYAAQDRLMGEQVAGLAPQVQGRAGCLRAGAGGHGGPVGVPDRGRKRFIASSTRSMASGGRTLRLANSHDHPTRYPLANRANLARALAEIGKRQGPEDVAFLFLASHGREDAFRWISPRRGRPRPDGVRLCAMLRESGIGPAVIVVSACHSGSFIDDIAAPGPAGDHRGAGGPDLVRLPRRGGMDGVRAVVLRPGAAGRA
jgi:hypothetical protein